MFDNEETDKQQDTQPTIPADLAEALKDIVGEDKKYKSVADALGSVKPAQDHITRLETEAAQLRAELDALKRTAASDAVNSAKDTKTADVAIEQRQESVDMQPSVREEVQRALREREEEETIKANQAAVVRAARAAFGVNAESELYLRASNVGMTKEQINKMAAENPRAALKLIGIDTQQPNLTINSTVNSAALKKVVTKPSPPTNWGNDAELSKYIRELAVYDEWVRSNT